MKKFDRLPKEERKREIMAASLELFNEKGFRATTMEDVVSRVSLSKGGVYRLYPSTVAILSDLMLSGMRMRNAYYAEAARKEIGAGRALTLDFLIGMIADSLFMAPEVSALYSEFLWEKRRIPELEALWKEIERTSSEETVSLMEAYGADGILGADGEMLGRITELMNAFTIAITVMGPNAEETELRRNLEETMKRILKI